LIRAVLWSSEVAIRNIDCYDAPPGAAVFATHPHAFAPISLEARAFGPVRARPESKLIRYDQDEALFAQPDSATTLFSDEPLGCTVALSYFP
jgi:hypothetical protein